MLKSLLMACGLSAALLACQQGGTTSRDTKSTTSSGTSTAPTQSSLPEGVSRDKVQLKFDTFSVTPMIFVKSTAENVCLPFKVTVTSEGKALAGATIAFTPTPTSVMKDLGEVLAVSTKSNSSGVIEGMYCSGESEGTLVVTAELSGLIVNSEPVRVTIKPIYKLSYIRSDVDPILSPSEGLGDSEAIYLNLIDSGPQDCTSVYFKLTKTDKAVAAAKVTFRSQVDFPAGAKFAKKADAVKTSIDTVTDRKYLSFESFTNGAGELSVPVCAGVFLGSIDVAASYTDEDSKTYETHAPVVRIVGGLTNWINMSLMFDEQNGRTMRGYFNTNSKYKLPITANIGSRQDGMPIKQYPLMVAAETGRVTIDDGGYVDPDTGTVKFTIQALHTVDNYPYMVYPFEENVGAQTRCSPQRIADWGLANQKTYVPYSDILKNWRSTVVYYIRGQEHYNDANGNGKYDVGGDGFWDRNQNGYFDAQDVLTYDAGNDGKFNRKGEWFIDLPTPFIDVDEDLNFDPAIDILIGEKFEAPNGKRDADTTDWKYEYLPISMGPSPYSLTHYRIEAANFANYDATVTLAGTPYNVFTVVPKLTPTSFWSSPINYSDSANYRWALFAHDICGSLLPGGTKWNMWLEQLSTNDDIDIRYARFPAINFTAPPEDNYLEPTRRLFRYTDTTRTNPSQPTEAMINFNAADHPSKDQGYPVTGLITIPQCSAPCTGAVDPTDPGHFCLGWQGFLKVQVSEPDLGSPMDASTTTMSTYIELPRITACKCVANATQSASLPTCGCNSNMTFNTTTKVCS